MHAELALEREDLVATVRALASVRGPVAREVAATVRVWPSIAGGPPPATAQLRAQMQAAAASASALSIPSPFSERQSLLLTGPASSISGTYRTYAVLARSAWPLIAADAQAIEGGTPAAARFARANVALYIESLYDAHFALAQIGKKVGVAFRALGGPRVFGKTLSQASIDELERFYSEANDRLNPHPATKLGS